MPSEPKKAPVKTGATPGGEKKVSFDPVLPEKDEKKAPIWITKKATQLVEIFGVTQEKAEAYVTENKFVNPEELIDRLLSDPAELAKLQ
jgi:hypothetical protein